MGVDQYSFRPNGHALGAQGLILGLGFKALIFRGPRGAHRDGSYFSNAEQIYLLLRGCPSNVGT